jgi:putative addiction module component (TIGR02574 family)
MTERGREILEQIRRLPEGERAQLVAEILATYETPDEEALDPTWIREIERRLDGYLTGKHEATPWEKVRDEVLAKHRKQ